MILKPINQGSILQLRVTVSKGTVNLFMNAVDQYIMAFQGADMIYVLQDQNSQSFKTSLGEGDWRKTGREGSDLVRCRPRPAGSVYIPA